MKVKKQIIAFYLVIAMLTIVVSSLFSVKVYAEVPSNQKAVKHNGAWVTTPFQLVGFGDYFVIADPTGIPQSTLVAPNMFYTTDQVKFDVVEAQDIFTTVLNYKVGVIVESIASLYSAWTSAIYVTDITNQQYVRQGVYDSNGTFYGIALNDIEGCYYEANSSDGINIPSDYSDNVYNWWTYYNENNNTVDWFTYYPDKDYVIGKIKTSLSQTTKDNITNILNSHDVVVPIINGYNNQYFYYSGDTTLLYFDDSYYINNSDYYWNGWNANILKGRNEIHQSEIVGLIDNGTLGNGVRFAVYDNDFNALTSYDTIDCITGTVSSTSLNDAQNMTYMGRGQGSGTKFWCGKEPFTIYKNIQTAQGLKNQTYSPTYYTTDSYNNYNLNEDNSITTNKRTVNNSITYNDNIYDDANGDYYNYVDNSTVHTENITTNVTNITNNYYNESDPDPDPDPNPDPDPDPDTPILDRLLQAILDFFEAIGKVIATILTGLIEMFASVLDAIAQVTSQITNLTEFFESILGWLPDPIPAVLGLGVSICILAAVIKFIRG